MREIILSKGYVAQVDDEDYIELSKYNWSVKCTKSTSYALRKFNNSSLYMHRSILNILDSSIKIDHIDHNGLNNQKNNLRICTTQQNNQNSSKIQWVSNLGYRGVTQSGNNFRAQISTGNSIKISLGSYPTKELAAEAYDRAAVKYHGEFATLNFPDKLAEYKLQTLHDVK